MTPDSPIKLVSELLDLPLIDSEGKYCGIVDDVELGGGVGKLQLKALLVGPGAYAGRLPAIAMTMLGAVVGKRVTRVPMNQVRTITEAVHLECPGRDVGLHKSETAAGEWIPRKAAL